MVITFTCKLSGRKGKVTRMVFVDKLEIKYTGTLTEIAGDIGILMIYVCDNLKKVGCSTEIQKDWVNAICKSVNETIDEFSTSDESAEKEKEEVKKKNDKATKDDKEKLKSAFVRLIDEIFDDEE